MRASGAGVRGFTVIGMALALLSIYPACAKREVVGAREDAGATVARPPVSSQGETARDTVRTRNRYSVEDEVPGRGASKPVELQEKLAPMKSDTFAVQELSVDDTTRKPYAIGYRVQIFASPDRAAAEKLRQRVAGETGMRAYLEYEDGLYKVRVGDFMERKEAAQARSKLEAKYPGSWIVRTTIRS